MSASFSSLSYFPICSDSQARSGQAHPVSCSGLAMTHSVNPVLGWHMAKWLHSSPSYVSVSTLVLCLRLTRAAKLLTEHFRAQPQNMLSNAEIQLENWGQKYRNCLISDWIVNSLHSVTINRNNELGGLDRGMIDELGIFSVIGIGKYMRYT